MAIGFTRTQTKRRTSIPLKKIHFRTINALSIVLISTKLTWGISSLVISSAYTIIPQRVVAYPFISYSELVNCHTFFLKCIPGNEEPSKILSYFCPKPTCGKELIFLIGMLCKFTELKIGKIVTAFVVNIGSLRSGNKLLGQ